jgi:hypothetical protein
MDPAATGLGVTRIGPGGVSCGASQMCTAVGHSQNAAGIETTLILTGD